VYSSKFGQPSSACKLAAVKVFCLSCIQYIFSSLYHTMPEIGDVFVTKELKVDWLNSYAHFYTMEKEDEIDQ
jgi:hypothetical protein